jgi:hypothetical protein
MTDGPSDNYIAQIVAGENRFDVTGQKPVSCFFNNVLIASVPEADQFGPVVGMFVISSCGVPETKIQVKGNPSYTDFLKDLIDTVTKSDQAKIFVLETKPDEMTDNKPLEARLTRQNLEDYRENMQTVSECLDETLTLADALTRTKLPRSAHGFKELDRTMLKIKTAVTELNSRRETCEISGEQVGIKIGQLITALSNEVKYPTIVEAAANQIATHSKTVKNTLSEVICSLHPLYNINPIFKKYTGYPVTWFYDPTTFYSFSERFKDASDHLIELARAENSIIKPLCRG